MGITSERYIMGKAARQMLENSLWPNSGIIQECDMRIHSENSDTVIFQFNTEEIQS